MLPGLTVSKFSEATVCTNTNALAGLALWSSYVSVILRRYLRPAARAAGIEKRIGWHTVRHSYSSLLRSVGAELKVMQELLRHSSFRSTLDVYTQVPDDYFRQPPLLGAPVYISLDT